MGRQAANHAALGDFKASLATLERGLRLYPAGAVRLQAQRTEVARLAEEEAARSQSKKRAETMMQQGNYEAAAVALASSLGLDLF